MSAKSCFPCLLILLAGLGPGAGLARAEAGRTTPGLVIETGARTAYCDQLQFSPDGVHLLAVGEDKVLRRWAVSAGGFLRAESVNVRWPIQREARGSIFAAAYDKSGERVAFAGYGLKTGLVATARLTPTNGRIESVCDPVPSPEPNWAVSFSPDGRYVVYGNETGEVYRWEPGTKAMPTLFAASKAKDRTANRVRLLSFIGPRNFVTVTMNGAVRVWDLAAPTAAPKAVHQFEGGSVFRAAISPDGEKIAIGLTATSKTAGTATGLQAARNVHLFNLRTKAQSAIPLPATTGTFAVRALAFSRDGARLAVGCNETPKLAREDFFRLKGAQVFVYALARPAAPAARMTLGYNVEALAFHPVRANLLASAGGDNHEVILWDASSGEKLSDDAEVRGPANSVWAVALDRRGRYFGWKDHRGRDPKHPNQLAAGAWRVFDLAGPTGRQILPTAPADFQPVLPIDSVDGWQVQPTSSSAVWRVTGPGGVDALLDDKSGLYDRKFNQEPRCWTFIKAAGKPLRLAVGHQWGVTLYECCPGGVRRVRVMSGHEGHTMCLAPSADGNLLISGGRDQTVCLWSLAPWDAGNEMGASFAVRGGKLVVTDVDPGSPAWEPLNPLDGTDREINRLAKGDTIDLLYIKSENFVYDPLTLFDKTGLLPVKQRVRNANEALAKLKAIRPATEYILVKQRPGVKELIFKLTTCRQRPLFRFFATRADNPGGGRDWVIWRPRDYYYDTSVNGDRYVGWHVNAVRLDQPPAFYPLERYRGSDYVSGPKGQPSGFHRADKIWPFVMRTFQEPEKVIFTDIEPPVVGLRVVEVPKGVTRVPGAPKVGTELAIEVTVTSANPAAPEQLLKHLNVFVNEYKDGRNKLAPTVLKRFRPTTIRLSPEDFVRGRNVVRVDCVNVTGGRGERELHFDYRPGERPNPRMHALVVGITDYSKAVGAGEGVRDLNFADNDARGIAAVLSQHARSANFELSNVTLIDEKFKKLRPDHPLKKLGVHVIEKRATAALILEQIADMGKRVRPDDWFVVFLAGHGSGKMVTNKNDNSKTPEAGTFFFVTADCDLKKPDTVLTSKRLYDALMAVKCRKMVILDACHSGSSVKDAPLLPSDGVRDLTREGKRLLVLASCQPNQEALEPSGDVDLGFKNGFFTKVLLDILTPAEKAGVAVRRQAMPNDQIHKRLEKDLPALLARIGVLNKAQTPAFSDADPAGMSVLCRPGSPKTGGGRR